MFQRPPAMSTIRRLNVGLVEVAQPYAIIRARCAESRPMKGNHVRLQSLGGCSHVTEATSDALGCLRAKVLVYEWCALGDAVLEDKRPAILRHVLGVPPNLAADNCDRTLELARRTAAFGPTIDKDGCVDVLFCNVIRARVCF